MGLHPGTRHHELLFEGVPHQFRLNALPPIQGMFVNLQGNGISDEYGPNNKEHQSLAEYFVRQLHTPSRFELPPEHQSAPKPPQRISM
mmetsp:Transcript_54421/g.97651  ORF Transcript_54421/g.97651 Transcript_54421/m.97651 type:complete len:88 (-) Transcript_54421:28-291(-)